MIKRSGKVEVKISNIVWDTDNLEDDLECLPKVKVVNLTIFAADYFPNGNKSLGFDIDTESGEIVSPDFDTDDFEEYLADYLTDEYDWCVDHFDYEVSPSFLNYLRH